MISTTTRAYRTQNAPSDRFLRFMKQAALYTAMGVLMVGCDIFKGKDDDPELDEQLEAALVEAADGQGMDLFLLPDSDDFNAIPQDPRNPITAKKVELGQLLYHETGLAVNPIKPEGAGTYSCASCHHAAAGFQAGRIQGVGEGGIGMSQNGQGRVNNPAYQIAELDVQPIRTPSAMNGAYQEAQLWNGQFGALGINAGTEAFWTPGTPKADNSFGYEGLEIQAIAGLKVHRMAEVENSIAATHARYTQLFAEAFPGQPIDREHAGLAIAAFERTMLANEAPFQKWLRGNKDAMTDQEKRGAVLFFDKAQCSTCHTGPALNSMTFYALGMDNLNGPGVYGDPSTDGARFGRGSFTGNAADNYKFKTPQLYNLMDSPFYGHGGTFNSVREVIEYKNLAVASNSDVPGTQLAAEFQPLGLTSDEISDLTAFVEGALYDGDLFRYVPNAVPSGNCLPANDAQTRTDLGCN